MSSYNSIAHLYSQGQLHKIIGVQPGTVGAKLKEACRVARLRSHPDKGGDGRVFSIVESAIQLLLNILPDIPHDGTPPARLVVLRKTVELCRQSFDLFGGDVTRLENLREAYITDHQRYLEQLRIERERRERYQARQEVLRYEASRTRVRKKLWKQSTQFPDLPFPMSHDRLNHLRKMYRNLGWRKYKYKKQEKDIQHIENAIQDILREARSIFDAEIEQTCQELSLCTHFPHIARKHPRYDTVTALKHSYQKLKDSASKSSEQLHQEHAERILQEAWNLVRQLPESQEVVFGSTKEGEKPDKSGIQPTGNGT